MDIDMERFWIHRLPWRRKGGETKAGQIRFLLQLQIVRDDGWHNLCLSLVNQSSFMVWIEHASIALADVNAKHQTATPTGSITQQILRYVGAKETLQVSVANAVYDAAGRPQGPYTCLLLANVRYCVFDEWCEAAAGTCRIAMTAINVIDLHSARWYHKENIMTVAFNANNGG
jgi:hypothetical protein